MKHNVLADGNGSTRIMVEGLGEYVPLSEFAELSAKVEQVKIITFQAVGTTHEKADAALVEVHRIFGEPE